jgi:hypothetical protein
VHDHHPVNQLRLHILLNFRQGIVKRLADALNPKQLRRLNDLMPEPNLN